MPAVISVRAQTINALSSNILPRSGRLKISGFDFGATQSAVSGVVRINGVAAPVSSWTNEEITAYVPETAPLGTGSVQVSYGNGGGNSFAFEVTLRPSAEGRVKWRFQANDDYIYGRPGVNATDGTIYVLGINGHLYALTPDGGLKWIFTTRSFPSYQSVSVGANGTIYFAGGNVVFAVNPDGSLKWQVANPSGGSVAAGPNVGPDGNIYAVFDQAATPQLGAVTISPEGVVLQNRKGYLQPRGQTFIVREIVFGSGRFYFHGLNNTDFNTNGLEIFQLGGTYNRTILSSGQPVVAPDGTFYSTIGGNPGTPERLGAYAPNGDLLRTLLPTETRLTAPDVGADGTIYIGHNFTSVSAYTPAGARRWQFPVSFAGNPVVNSQNTVVAVADLSGDDPSHIYGINASNGQSLWTVDLPSENGGKIAAVARLKFSPDGATVYAGTDYFNQTPDTYCYFYAIQATDTPSHTATTNQAKFDFDGDGKTDISLFRGAAGQWWMNLSSTNQTITAQFGNSSDTLTPGDFTGDGKTDIGVFRPASAEWFILRSEDNSFYSFPFGANGDIPIVGDFDADGKADAGIFRPSNSTWYIRKSAGGTTIQQFGQTGDVPVVADYDGDGKSDIAVYRVSQGEWWINRSNLGTIAFRFGNSNDKPVQGDYTGDGKADVAFFRPATGEWFVLRSENQSYYSFPFGANGDTPAPGDYDGDGKMDATVFRTSNNTWYSQRTTAGTLIQAFGQSGDKPVPNAFVP
ncbi:MAG TPA: FG-GAP-like repeat-containing protein [Pyrinomonadaceae bacterium]